MGTVRILPRLHLKLEDHVFLSEWHLGWHNENVNGAKLRSEGLQEWCTEVSYANPSIKPHGNPVENF